MVTEVCGPKSEFALTKHGSVHWCCDRTTMALLARARSCPSEIERTFCIVCLGRSKRDIRLHIGTRVKSEMV